LTSIFLSHTSIDKPFVEKLANDLKRVGISVWFDKWEIKVRESITYKIEEGIKANEYLAIVLSPEAVSSEWVKIELTSALIKQIQEKRVRILPILYRDCNIPLFLLDKRYADFRKDYDLALNDLLGVFGLDARTLINATNWRKFTRGKSTKWTESRKEEFEILFTELVDMAQDYKWSVWVGAKKMPLSFTLSARSSQI